MESFLKDTIVVTALLGWLIAQLLKVVFVLIGDKRLDFSRLTGSGGMPSSHSSLVCSLSTAVGFSSGWSSDIFVVCLVLSLIVMYDAAGVRYAAGKQASILNKIMEEWEEKGTFDGEKHLKELLGHTPFQVICGALLGIFIGLLRHYILV